MRLRPVALALGLLATARAGDAQAVRLAHAADPAAVAACLDTIPASAFARVAVHVEATLDDSTQRALLPSVDLFAQGVAQRARAAIGATPDGTLPAADPAMPWRALPATVHVTAHRDGRLTWVRADTGALRTADTAGSRLLSEAVAAAHAEGERVPWPTGLAVDSAAFDIELGGPTIRRDGTTTLEGVRRSFPAFTLALPWAEPVRLTVPPRIVYPETSLRGGAQGLVILRYVVDERGRLAPATIEEWWPASQPRLRGDLGRFYAAFQRATERALPTARFEPARIGGCAVPQPVEQGFAYGIRR